MAIRVVKVAGSPYAMGVQFGRAVRDEVHALAAERLKLTLQEMEIAGIRPDEDFCLETAREMLTVQQAWNPVVHAEFCGIADGAGIDPARLLIGNGFTDFKDVVVQRVRADVTECTSLFVLPEATATGRSYAAQTWDMHASAEPFVLIVERHPDDGPKTLALTTAGCLSLIGVNEAGIAIGNNNLTPDDARPGVIYLAMIHAALQQRRFDDAVAAITGAPRASGHHYYIVDDAGRGAGIETSALKYRTFAAEGGVYGHANHYLAAELAGSAGSVANSHARQESVDRLLAAKRGEHDVETLKRILESREALPDCICRHGDEATTGADPRRSPAKTCAAAVIDPAARGFWATWGPPDQAVWEWHALEV